MLRGPLGSRVGRWLRQRRLERITQRRRSHGIPVLITTTGEFGTHDELFERLDRALALVATHQPWRIERLRRDLGRIWVNRLPSFRAAYRHDIQSCLLDTYFVSALPLEAIAASIAHEAVHARVAKLPIQRKDRAREERLCRRAEVSVGHALPDGAAVVARAQAARDATDDEVAPFVDWAEVAREQRRAEIRERTLPAALERWLLARVR